MRRLVVFLGLVCCLLTLCCAPRATCPPPAAKPDVTTVRVYRTFELTVHADTEFLPQGRQIIEQAAAKWSALSNGHIRIRVEFDLDFDSIENLKAHQAAQHSVLIGLKSDYKIAQQLDEKLGGPGVTPLAATVRQTDDGPVMVFLIMDRIEDGAALLSVVTHEFGHVANMPDLPTSGSVMSGARRRNEEPVTEFNEADIALCRAARYCE